VNSFNTGFSENQLEAYHQGVARYRYKGIPCLKSPIDIAIYLQLLFKAQPSTIFEIGSAFGGSALLLRDFSIANGSDAKVVSIDIKDRNLEDLEGIRFLQGDVFDLENTFASHELFCSPRPWLVIEDSAHTLQSTIAALDFFSRHLESGEYLIIEDGVLEDLGWSEKYDGGPNRAIKEFLQTNPNDFEIDRSYCDMFGQNMTYNPNGYLRKC